MRETRQKVCCSAAGSYHRWKRSSREGMVRFGLIPPAFRSRPKHVQSYGKVRPNP